MDYDVHHGQGTQRMFYDDPRVLYFSIHRYEHGTFWPNLRESDFDYIGEGKGAGYNFNVPLNKIGMTNADYLAIWQQILVPVATEVTYCHEHHRFRFSWNNLQDHSLHSITVPTKFNHCVSRI